MHAEQWIMVRMAVSQVASCKISVVGPVLRQLVRRRLAPRGVERSRQKYRLGERQQCVQWKHVRWSFRSRAATDHQAGPVVELNHRGGLHAGC